MTAQLSRERLEKIASWREKFGADHNVMLPAEEAEAMARMLLAGMDSKPVGEVVLGDYDDCGDYPDAKVVCIAAQGQADWNNFRNGTKLYIAPPAQQPELTVWYGSMPESNGKTNWTAILHRKGEGRCFDGFTIDRSEYPGRVRYAADRVRYLIGELPERPHLLDYDGDEHSGYAAPPAPVAVPDVAALRIIFEKWFAADCAFDGSPSATEEDNLAWKEGYWHVWKACRAAMLKAGPVTGWIKCSERMPEEGGRYWCYVEEQNSLGKSHYQWNCSWNGDEWSDKALTGRVTHWMPLPTAPEQE